jgi:hypothetical protein
MIKVNTKTLVATREPIPEFINGIYGDELKDLSWADSALGLKDFGWWDEVDATPDYDSTTHTLDGTEVLTVNATNKTVEVLRGVRAKTVDELRAEFKALVPQVIKKWRGQLVLHRRSLLEQVEALVTQSPEMSIIYKNVTDFERNNTLIASIASVTGWDDEYIDEFFIEASLVVAG